MQEKASYPQLRADKDVKLSVCSKKIGSYPLHWHDFFEIEIVTAGRGTHILNGKEYGLGVGSAYLLKPTDYHEIRTDGELEISNITFRGELLSEALLMAILHSEQRKLQTLTGERLEGALAAVKLLQIECNTGGDFKRPLLEYLVNIFVGKQTARLNRQQLAGINKALVYMEFHFREPLTLTALAREAGFHPTYLSELFKKTTGESFIEKLSGLRLEYACTLLANNCSVSYACFESGFGSLSNFFIAFKKKYGISPGEYAKAPRDKR